MIGMEAGRRNRDGGEGSAGRSEQGLFGYLEAGIYTRDIASSAEDEAERGRVVIVGGWRWVRKGEQSTELVLHGRVL